ncbi:MAG: tRNA (adenosine(37)-N6)-methyltransferase TrmM, partial [Marivirga sp.]|nr:tRNA (adenosine(37)-N6)-methyltransferase TrmM [Marivirga sp.]
MKVGTDAVLLACWARVTNQTKILDIGTGSGVIALVLAQRTSPPARIDAVEIEEQDAKQAGENFLQSPWSDRLHVHHLPIQEFLPEIQYDMIITNPPYFVNSQQPPDKRRTATRHTVSLDYKTLLSTVTRLLHQEGTFNIILPYTEGIQFTEMAIENRLFCSRKFIFRTRKEKPIERWLLEFSFRKKVAEHGEIILYEEDL